MKSQFYKFIVLIPVLLILNLSFLIKNSEAQWVQMPNGIGNNQFVYSLATLGNNILAGTGSSNGVYLSTNNGTSWTQTALNNQSVYSFALLGNNIFAGSSFSVYLSTNNGTTWTQTALNNQWVYSLATLGNNIFAGTYQHGVYLSTNNGMSWTQAGLNNQDVWSLTTLGNNIFAGTSDIGVFLSTNNGTTWTQTALNNQDVWSLATLGNNIFAGTQHYGVYLSTNNGTNWTQTALNNESVYSLTTFGNNIFTGTDYGVYLSTNNGASWLIKNQGFNPVSAIRSLLIANNYIFAGTSGYSVWRRGYTEAIGIKKISKNIPSSYVLHQNYPNPFNPLTTIKFDIPQTGNVILKIFDVTGKEVAILINEKLNPGTYETQWNTSEYSSGIYFYRLETNDYRETKRMILIK